MLILKNFRSTTKILPLKISPFKVIDQLYGHARNISIKNIYFEIFFRIQVLVIITFQFLNPTSFTSTPLQFFNILKTSFYKYLVKNQIKIMQIRKIFNYQPVYFSIMLFTWTTLEINRANNLIYLIKDLIALGLAYWGNMELR